MKKLLRHKKVIIGAFIILLSVLITMTIFAEDKNESSDALFEVTDRETYIDEEQLIQAEEGKIVYPICNREEILDEIGRDNIFEDPRAGFIFRIPDGFEVIDMDEYYILYNPNEPEGCLQFYANADAEFLSPYEAYCAIKRLKDRVCYKIDGELYRTDLYDFTTNPKNVTVEVNDHPSIQQDSLVYAGQQVLDTRFISTRYYDRGVTVSSAAVAYSGKTEYFQEKALEVFATLSALAYPEGRACNIHCVEMFAYREASFSDLTFQVPTSWDEMVLEDGSVVFRPYPVYGDHMQFSQIYVYKGPNRGMDLEYDYLQMYEYFGDNTQCANVTMQNPFIDNNRKMQTLGGTEGVGLETINGRTWMVGHYNHNVVLGQENEIYSSFPEKNISTIHYTTEAEDGDFIHFVFYRDIYFNFDLVQELSEKVMNTVN